MKKSSFNVIPIIFIFKFRKVWGTNWFSKHKNAALSIFFLIFVISQHLFILSETLCELKKFSFSFCRELRCVFEL